MSGILFLELEIMLLVQRYKKVENGHRLLTKKKLGSSSIIVKENSTYLVLLENLTKKV